MKGFNHIAILTVLLLAGFQGVTADDSVLIDAKEGVLLYLSGTVREGHHQLLLSNTNRKYWATVYVAINGQGPDDQRLVPKGRASNLRSL